MSQASSKQSFRLLDLPQELQDKVLQEFFANSKPVFHVDYRSHKPFQVPDIDLSIEYVSKKVSQDARAARNRHLQGIVRIDITWKDIVSVLSIENFDLEYLCFARCVVKLELHGLLMHEDVVLGRKIRSDIILKQWDHIFATFPRLRHLNLEFEVCSSVYNGAEPNACHILAEVKSGKMESLLVRGMNSWLQLAKMDERLANSMGSDHSIECSIRWSYRIGFFTDRSKWVDTENVICLNINFAIQEGQVVSQKTEHNADIIEVSASMLTL